MSEEPAAAGPRAERSEQVRDKILTAAGELMMAGSLAAVTMEAIAARAGVSKRTLYKYWPSRGAVALEGFMRRAEAQAWSAVPEGASAADALEVLVVAAARLFTDTPAGPLMRSLVADAMSQDEIADALRDQWLGPRREATARVIDRGMASGELRPGLEVEVVMDLLFAPVYYRLLFGHQTLDAGFAARAARYVIGGLLAAPAA
jgi:AcrR family transcriptional regulator